MNQPKEINDILKIVTFLKDNMASKQDLARLESRLTGVESKMTIHQMATNAKFAEIEEKMVTKDDFFQFRSEIVRHVDKVLGKYDKCDTEIAAINDNYHRHDRQIRYLADHASLDLPA